MTLQTDIVITFHSTPEFRTEDCLKHCVATLQEKTKNFRLIFVDDNSDPQGAAYINSIAATFPQSTLIRTFHQRWFTRAVNLGLRLARTPWCVELNSDVSLGDGWLEELYAVRDDFETKNLLSKIGLVGSVYSEGESRRYASTFPPDYVTGHCWLINMKAAEEVGASNGTPKDYLDETSARSIHIFSDNHLCYRMNQLGWATLAAFKSPVGHAAGKSWGHQLHRIPSRISEVEYRYE